MARSQPAAPKPSPTPIKPKTEKTQDERDVVLLCNPRAGGRWRELADILDSEEAKGVRRITTDDVADIGPALSTLSKKTPLVCIYGGDGTIHRILNEMLADLKGELPQMAFIGGGTMNVTARWCGHGRSPGMNFRYIMRAYRAGELFFKEVPLLRVEEGPNVRHGFIFGQGALIRLLDQYENHTKGKLSALAMVAKSVIGVWSRWPADFQHFLQEMDAEVKIDGEKLPYGRFVSVFCNITGHLNIGVAPFMTERLRDTFYCLAYAIDRRELTALLPFIIRGKVPIDPKSLLTEVSVWKQMALSLVGRGTFPTDPRYVNRSTVKSFEVTAPAERMYTVDGEIFETRGAPISVTLGPTLRLAVSPTSGLTPAMRLAADVTAGVKGKVGIL
jgi:hypothetical protein